MLFQVSGSVFKYYSHPQASLLHLWRNHKCVKIPIFDHVKVTTIYFSLLHKHVLTFLLSCAQMGTTNLSCGSENRLTVIALYFTDNSSTADNMLTTSSGLGCSPGKRGEWGDRKTQCSSHRCTLILITTLLSLQQTAYSLAFHFRDNSINQI